MGIRQEFFSLGETLLSKLKKKFKKGKKMDLIHQRNSSSLSSLGTFEAAAAGLQQDGSPATHPGTDHPQSKGEKEGAEEGRRRRRRRSRKRREGRPLRRHGAEGMARVSGRQAGSHP